MTGETIVHRWQAGVALVLVVLWAIAVLSDLRQRRIPNALVMVTLLAGLLFNSFGPQFSGAGGLFSTQPGALGFWRALAGAATAFALFIPFYALRLLGAGDVKLLAGVGAFAGPAAFINLALFVLLAGGVLALARMAWARNGGLVMRNVFLAVSQGMRLDAPGSSAPIPTAWRMPYALAIAGGVLAYGAWILSGRAPIIPV